MPSPTKTRRAASKPKPSAPSEIAPGVFVGGWKEALQFQGTRFCVLDERPEDMPPATHVKIYDEPSDRANVANLDRLAAAMQAAHADGTPVMVFCGHGVYRSPLGGAWYLHRAEGLTLDEAYVRVRSVRPKAIPARTWVGNSSELERA